VQQQFVRNEHGASWPDCQAEAFLRRSIGVLGVHLRKKTAEPEGPRFNDEPSSIALRYVEQGVE
jgi:hypothetical protein